MDHWEQSGSEMEKAQIARQNHNEGMARVCARRAAGFALQGFLTKKGEPASSTNVIVLLNDPVIRAIIPVNLHPILDHLLLKVDENYEFVPEVDLLQETQFLIKELKNLKV